MIKSPNSKIRNFLSVPNSDLVKFSEAHNDMLDEPTFYCFSVHFNLFSDHLRNEQGVPYPGTETIPLGLLLGTDQIESAINFLRRRNLYKQSEALTEFRNMTDYIQTNRPHFFQSVSGLQEIFKFPESGVPYRLKNHKIKFETLESLDNIMSFWINLYRVAVYDWKYLKYNLPIDKRRFEMEITVAEFRDLYTIRQIIGTTTPPSLSANSATVQAVLANEHSSADIYKAGQNSPATVSTPMTSEIPVVAPQPVEKEKSQYKLQSLNDYITYYKFTFPKCVFDFEESFDGFGKVSNSSQSEPVAQSFSVEVEEVDEFQQYGFFEWILTSIENFGIPHSGRALQDGLENYDEFRKNLSVLLSPLGKDIQTDIDTYINEQRALHDYNNDSNKFKDISSTIKGDAFVEWAATKAEKEARLADPANSFLQYGGNDTSGPAKTIDQKSIYDTSQVVEKKAVDQNWKNAYSTSAIENIDNKVLGKMDFLITPVKETIDPVTLTMTEPNKKITEVNLHVTEPKKTIDPVQFESAEPKKTIDQLQFDVTPFKDTIDPIQFDETPFKDTIDPIKLDETPPKDTIDQLQFDETPVKDTIDPVELTETPPKDTIDEVQLSETPAKDTIDQLQFDTTPFKETIDPIELTETSPKDTIDLVELVETPPKDDIDPDTIKFESKKPKETINPKKIKFESKEPKKTINPKNIYK